MIKTFKGSKIARDNKYGVGKRVGSKLYMHRQFALKIVPAELLFPAERCFNDMFPYNVIRYDEKSGDICFIESPDFDTADEPLVGRWFSVQTNGDCSWAISPAVYHHKWLFVQDNYTGFDVQTAKERSAYLCEHIQETMIGGSARAWSEQKRKWGIL